jgi:hypothetical protein
MASLIHPLRTLLTSLTRQELAKQVAFLTKKRILRKKLREQMVLSNFKRRQLVKYGKSLR